MCRFNSQFEATLFVSIDIPLLGSLVPFLQVVAGDHDLTDDQGDFYKVSSVLMHPDYKNTLSSSSVNKSVDYDFAILTLTKKITFSPTVAPICLPASVQADFAVEEATVTGWGSTLVYGISASFPTTLQEVDMQVMENSQCLINGLDDWTAKR